MTLNPADTVSKAIIESFHPVEALLQLESMVRLILIIPACY